MPKKVYFHINLYSSGNLWGKYYKINHAIRAIKRITDSGVVIKHQIPDISWPTIIMCSNMPPIVAFDNCMVTPTGCPFSLSRYILQGGFVNAKVG